jgi:hypothetical protein
MTAHPSRGREGMRRELAAEVVDAVAARDAAWAAYLAAPEYTDTEDRAREHAEHATAAVLAAEQRLARFDRRGYAPPRWSVTS